MTLRVNNVGNIFLMGKRYNKKFLSLFLFSWPHLSARGILVPQPGIKPVPPAVEAHSLNHWTTREVPEQEIKKKLK